MGGGLTFHIFVPVAQADQTQDGRVVQADQTRGNGN